MLSIAGIQVFLAHTEFIYAIFIKKINKNTEKLDKCICMHYHMKYNINIQNGDIL